MRWTLIIGILVILLGIIFLGLFSKGEPGIVGKIISEPEYGVESDISVNIVNYVYTPKDLEISVGEIVTWINKDYSEHTITSMDGLFDSGLLKRGDTFSHKFDKVGIYEYYCIPHPYMKGKIIVK